MDHEIKQLWAKLRQVSGVVEVTREAQQNGGVL